MAFQRVVAKHIVLRQPFSFKNDNYEFKSLGIITSNFPFISEKFIW